jgi:hypothetical protein
MNILNISIFNHLIYPIYNFIILYIYMTYIWHISSIYPRDLYRTPRSSWQLQDSKEDLRWSTHCARPSQANTSEPTGTNGWTNGNQWEPIVLAWDQLIQLESIG